ncbi:hypothetical protein [Burkholderia gladioli]|uniref:hypothetical protein n=1 Tax=Burkholderia gladioli TaxID=28095 RepID=UPI00163F2940|nr:hypothetical protein [Burkholderia gladioli]
MEIENAKRAFFEKMKSIGVFAESDRAEIDRNFESALDLAVSAKQRMPGIGFFSPQKRVNAFLSVCHHIDALPDSNNQDVAQLALIILRFRDKAFMKAMVMFEIRAPRFSLKDIVEMPETARAYLSTMRRF